MDKEILSFPFNSRIIDGKHDRVWNANAFAQDRQVFIGNGIYPNPSDALKVVSLYNNMKVILRGGAAWIEGHCYVQGKIKNSVVIGFDLEFDVPENETSMPRKDMIVLDCSNVRRNIIASYIIGSTELVRNDDVFQLKLAEIAVNPSTIYINPADILDTRLDKEVCGIVHGVVDQVDTTDIFNQYKAYLDNNIALWDSIKNSQTDIWTLQTENQQIDHEEHMRELRAISNEMELLIRALETQSFTLINNNFDDWSVKRGCDFRHRITRTDEDDRNSDIKKIESTITVTAIDYILATKTTEIERVNGEISRVIVNMAFYPWTVNEGGNIVLTTRTNITQITDMTKFNTNDLIMQEVR